jgi:hypothetical protein
MPFSVHIDQEELAMRDLAAGLSGPSAGEAAPDPRKALKSPRRDGRDSRQAARGQSERDHSRVGSGRSRTYAFRRS